jgi:hypothetical protein
MSCFLSQLELLSYVTLMPSAQNSTYLFACFASSRPFSDDTRHLDRPQRDEHLRAHGLQRVVGSRGLLSRRVAAFAGVVQPLEHVVEVDHAFVAIVVADIAPQTSIGAPTRRCSPRRSPATRASCRCSPSTCAPACSRWPARRPRPRCRTSIAARDRRLDDVERRRWSAMRRQIEALTADPDRVAERRDGGRRL